MIDKNTILHVTATSIKQGFNFQIKEAHDFATDENQLMNISRNQLNGLAAVVNKADNFEELKEEVQKWISDQANKDSGEQWRKIKDELINGMFDWDAPRVKQLQESIARKLRASKIVEHEIKDTLSKKEFDDNLEKIKFIFARKFFFSLLTIYRVHCIEGDKDIGKKLKEALNENI